MDEDQSAIVLRSLEEEGIDAPTLLNVLVQTLVGRHVLDTSVVAGEDW